ncbi:MAG: flavodoxin family protein [Mailhella sp.]|nr:flavodoxin family protein [Mailhella sp.]
MNVLLINGSPHPKGCTFTARSEVAATLEAEGVTAEILQVGSLPVRGCLGCYKCRETGRCVIDDIVNEAAAKFAAADGLVIGSPVYYASPNGTMLSFLDRLFFSSGFSKAMKVGASVVSARRGGCTASFDALNKYFTISNMPIVASQYWNMVHGKSADEVRQDLEGLQTMRTLGRNMAFLIKSIALGREEYGIPEREPWIATNFIR